MNENLIQLYNEVNMLHDVAVMLTKSDFKSVEARAFNAGSEFALNAVLKLIGNILGEK